MADLDMSSNTIELATELTIAWLNNPNNRASADDVPAFLQRMHSTLNALSTSEEPAAASDDDQGATPAVSVRKSLASKDFIISLIDGKPYKSLKRHLARHGLTPEHVSYTHLAEKLNVGRTGALLLGYSGPFVFLPSCSGSLSQTSRKASGHASGPARARWISASVV
ncbi:transcriptional regulator [Tolypothrix campylonemoides VB511288]|nr:transcriptional regulator [Tolypothrix campylonemoides VB511288]